eukprot:gene11533-7953_t
MYYFFFPFLEIEIIQFWVHLSVLKNMIKSPSPSSQRNPRLQINT